MSSRSTIRQSVLDRLSAATGVGGLLAGYDVESSRYEPVEDSEEGAEAAKVVLVYADRQTDTPETRDTWGHHYAAASAVSVVVVGFAPATTASGAEDAADELHDALDTLLLGDQTWLDTLAGHPGASWETDVQTRGGRFRAVVALTLDCVVAREVP